MKLYQTKYYDGGEDTPDCAAWSGTQVQASKDRLSLIKNGKERVNTVETDVPTNKADLIAFLNANQVVA